MEMLSHNRAFFDAEEAEKGRTFRCRPGFATALHQC